MKYIVQVWLVFGILSVGTLHAQRYAYVDTEYILSNLKSYDDAQKELDQTAQMWQKEIEDRYEAIERLQKSYQAERVLLTAEMRTEREEEILRKETEARELKRQRFGVDGDLFQKRQELIQPIQEEVYNAIKEVAQGGGFSVIFDKAGQSNILYADPRYDKSDRVLSRLGVTSRDRESGNDDDEPVDDEMDRGQGAGGRDTGRPTNSSPQRR